jgi:asparagine synthetase B (glutamine-hydrolysing)
MGSIAAVMGRSAPPEAATSERMIGAAPHRGNRVEHRVQGQCVLAIGWIPDRPDATLWAEDGLAVAFAGVLDNLVELAKQLQDDGGAIASESPAAVVAAGYRTYGEALPARLRGVYTAAITDGRKLVCFRDHLGFGTLFYRHDASGSYVATEAKQVVSGARISRLPNLEVLERTFFQDLDDETPSALRGVNRLPKATTLTVEPGRARIRRYWDPGSLLETARLGTEELHARFDHLMDQAAARTVTGNDAVSLSGGIDSPAVAAYAAPVHERVAHRSLGALSAVYPDHPSVDERRYVELVAGDLGLPLHTYEQRASPLDGLAEWMRLADTPVPTISLPHYEESYRRARELGYGTVLTGELAELVADTPHYLLPHLLFRGRFGALLGHVRARRAAGASVRSLARALVLAVAPTPAVALRWRLRRAGIPAWLDRRRVNAAAARSIVPGRERWRKIQLGAFEGPGISVEADAVCQEVTGIRNRRPWADIDLWEFFLSLPAEVKFPDSGSKTLVRRLLRGRVPTVILDRRDKTLFDESIMAHIDYPTLRRWLIRPDHRVAGVRYDILEERLERGRMDLAEFMWAKDLAAVHAFLSQW